jgi:membrane-associated phospholipid phosphatase
VLLGYWGVVMAVQLIFAGRIAAQGARVLPGLLLLDALMIAALVGVARLVRDREVRSRYTIKSAMVFATAYLAFMAMEFYLHAVNPVDFEAVLVDYDRRLFGSSGAEALERFTLPIVADYCQFCYVTHYAHAFVLFGFLLQAGKIKEAQELMGIVAACFTLTFLGYILIPARSPHVIAALPETAHLLRFDGPLPLGPLAAGLNAWIQENEVFKRDCFPSGHAMLAVAVLVSSWRYYRPTFPFYAALLGGLVAGTMLLRYHYVVDLLAGGLVAWAIVALVPRLNDRWVRFLQ